MAAEEHRTVIQAASFKEALRLLEDEVRTLYGEDHAPFTEVTSHSNPILKDGVTVEYRFDFKVQMGVP